MLMVSKKSFFTRISLYADGIRTGICRRTVLAFIFIADDWYFDTNARPRKISGKFILIFFLDNFRYLIL